MVFFFYLSFFDVVAFSFFFFNDTATTEIYTLSLHDALPIPCHGCAGPERGGGTPHRSKSRHPASAADEIADHQARSLPMSSRWAPLRPANRLYARPACLATRTVASGWRFSGA